jgi:hypothetical protein
MTDEEKEVYLLLCGWEIFDFDNALSQKIYQKNGERFYVLDVVFTYQLRNG